MITNQSVYDEMCEVYRKFLWGELVEGTRCKDCTWFDSPNVCLRHGRFVENGNWFCADGKRGDRDER